MIIFIIALIVFGIFESWIYHKSHREEDFYITAISFFAAGFLILVILSGNW